MQPVYRRVTVVLGLCAIAYSGLSFVIGEFLTLSPHAGFHVYLPVERMLIGGVIQAPYAGLFGILTLKSFGLQDRAGPPPGVSRHVGWGIAVFFLSTLSASVSIAAVTAAFSNVPYWSGFFASTLIVFWVYIGGGLLFVFGGIAGVIAARINQHTSRST